MSRYKITKKQINKEIVRCGKDPVYFINNYVKVVHPVKGLIPFKTYPFQTQLLKDFNNHRKNVILKARQLGISTITAGYILWLMLFYRNKYIFVLATKFQTASIIAKKVKAMMKALPPWMAVSKIEVDNRTNFKLDNGSEIKASTKSSDAGRGDSLSLLVIDEAAHIPNMDEIWTGVSPTISTGGKVIALSTPFGVGNWFHKTCTEAESELNDFHLTTLFWDAHPDRDAEWFEKETKNLSKREVAQEYLCSFNASGDTVIHPDDIKRLDEGVVPPKYRSGFDRNYWIWEEFDPLKNYIISADVARGDGTDYSAFHIVEIDSLDVVAEYQGKLSVDMYSRLLFDAGKEYGNCLLVVENNNVGLAVIEKLITMEYPNLYYSIKGSEEIVQSYEAESRNNAIAGFATSQKSRPLIISKLEEYIRNDWLKIRSKRLVHELTTFIWNNGRPEAMRKRHDDLVMALAIACWIRDTAVLERRKNDKYKKAMLDGMFLAKTKLDVRVPGQEGYNKNLDLEVKRRHAIKQYQEFDWVYKG